MCWHISEGRTGILSCLARCPEILDIRGNLVDRKGFLSYRQKRISVLPFIDLWFNREFGKFKNRHFTERNIIMQNSENFTIDPLTGTQTLPFTRLRRTRMTAVLRSMVRETELSKNDFIYPLFVCPGTKVRREVSSMPGVYQMSVDEIVRECIEVKYLGIPAVILFGIPEHKDDLGSEAYDELGIVQRAIHAIKKEVPDLLVITDVCLCEYTSHGHCGVGSMSLSSVRGQFP